MLLPLAPLVLNLPAATAACTAPCIALLSLTLAPPLLLRCCCCCCPELLFAMTWMKILVRKKQRPNSKQQKSMQATNPCVSSFFFCFLSLLFVSLAIPPHLALLRRNTHSHSHSHTHKHTFTLAAGQVVGGGQVKIKLALGFRWACTVSLELFLFLCFLNRFSLLLQFFDPHPPPQNKQQQKKKATGSSPSAKLYRWTQLPSVVQSEFGEC